MSESQNTSPTLSPEEFRTLQKGLDSYLQNRKSELEHFLASRLHLKECFQIQKKHWFLDLILNPINALWAIPALTLRKGLEVGEKLGWDAARGWSLRIPQAFQTHYQKQIAKILKEDFFGIRKDSMGFELQKNPDLQRLLTGPRGRLLAQHLHDEISAEIDQYSVRQSGFTDLVSSGVMVLIADKMFGDRSLDLFGLGKKLASLLARRNAEDNFFFGKTLGRVFYKLTPPPAPTTGQIVLMTVLALLTFSLLSTIISVLSHPTQQRLGFRQKQIEKLIENLKPRILLKLLNDSETSLQP